MNNPYDTPNAAPQIDSELKEFPKFRKLAVTGIILLTGPFFGVLGTVIGMTRAFATLSASEGCLLYTSPSPRDATLSRMPSSA